MTHPVDDPQTETVCYRHRNRPTNVACQNCGKPICADCMRESPVGYRCPDCAPQRRFALADDLAMTKAIIGVNVAVFLVGVVLTLIDGASGANPLTGGSSDLTLHGGLVARTCETIFVQTQQCASTVGVADGQWWRLLTSGFLHGGLFHVGFNMYFIWVFGQLLEPAMGRLRFVLLYFAALFGGSIGALAMTPDSFTVGASGAAFGLLGAALAVSRIRRLDGLTSNLLTVAAINFAISILFAGNISLGGHIGGFVTGLALGALVFGPLARQRSLQTAALAAAIVVLFVGGIVVAGAVAIPAVSTG